MTITRSGTNKSYSNNWAKAFGGKSTKSATITVAKRAVKSAPKRKLIKAKTKTKAKAKAGRK